MARLLQKQKVCSVEGCEGMCISNDLCARHGQARHRATEKGKAYVKEYNKRYKRPDISKVCIHCSESFVTARVNQELCSKCSPVVGLYKSQKRYREKQKAERTRRMFLDDKLEITQRVQGEGIKASIEAVKRFKDVDGFRLMCRDVDLEEEEMQFVRNWFRV
jgi:hypothetical protein